MRRIFGLILVLLLSGATKDVFSQEIQPCGTDQIWEVRSENPAFQALEIKSDRMWERHVSQASMERRGGTLTIPCVVHIVQTSLLDKVSEGHVHSQIQVLNEDFRKMALTPGFGTGVDTQIEFCLAKIDPNGCPTSGINRIISPLGDHDINAESQLKGLIQWDPEKYLNIWVPERIAGNILGYATFPTWMANSPQLDGIVVHGQYFGRDSLRVGDYYQGRTATHEVGHWLGLYHTFQDGCAGLDSQSCSSAGDRVCDTPPVAAPNYSCPFGINSCAESPVDLPDQVENYMDYSNGICMNAFTQGQSDRMDFHIGTYRSVLCSPANLAATGCDGGPLPLCPPTADFESDRTEVCAGLPVSFWDLSTGSPSAWSWTANGAGVATATMQNPVFQWGNPGDYTVKLEVSNAAGSDTEEKTAYISVRTATPQPYIQGFEGLRPLPEGWAVLDEDGRGAWSRRNDGQHSGSAAIVAENYERDAEGSEDWLISRAVDLGGQSTAALEFYYAYKRFNAFKPDTLRVMASNDCGETWTAIWERSNLSLATVGGFQYTSEFIPGANDWERVVLDLNAFAGASNFRLAFVNIGRGGQNLWLDDINIASVVGRESALQPVSFDLWPNPASEAINLAFWSRAGERYELSLWDMTGRKLGRWTLHAKSTGNQTWQMEEGFWQQLPAGVYGIRLDSGEGSRLQKIVKP